MAKELLIGLVIGATLNGSFTAAFRKADKTVAQLGKGLDSAMRSQERLGSKIERAQTKQLGLQQRISYALLMGDGNANKLIRRYERMQSVIGKAVEKQNQFTQAIQKAQKAQTGLSAAIEKQEQRRQQRDKLKGDIVSSTAMTASVTMPAWKAVKTYIDQENASNNLKIAMMKADGSYGRFNDIDKKTDSLGKRLPGTKADFTLAAIALKNQGISDDVIYNGGLDTAAELGVLLDMAPAESGEFLAKYMEARGLAESELPDAADYLQRAKFASGLTKEQMYGSMSYNASTIRALGWTGLENAKKLLALEGMSGQQALEGTSFGTNFSTMLDRLNEGPKMMRAAKKGMKAEAQDMVNAVGVDFQFFDKKGAIKSIDGVIKELLKFKKIKEKFGDEGVGLVAKELFNVEGARVAKVLIAQGEEGLANFLAKMDEQASLSQRIEQKISTLGSALESLGGVWDTAVGTIGSAFADDIRGFADWASAIIENDLTPLLKEHKTAIKWGIGIASGLTMASTAVLAFKFAFSGITSVLTGLFIIPKHLFKAGSALNGIAKVGGKLSIFSRMGRSLMSFGRTIGGVVVKGLMLAGKAFMWLGRAMLMNPIGLVMTGLAIGAYYIWQNWEKLKPLFTELWQSITAKFDAAWAWIQSVWSGIGEWVANAWSGVKDFFSNLWAEVTTAFDGGILGIGKLILDWSPIGLFHKAFAAVLSWFGIDIPNNFSTFATQALDNFTQWVTNWDILGTFQSVFDSVFAWFGNLPSRFAEFGGNIVDGIKSGISGMATSAKESVVGFADNVGGWFKKKLNINSPSRVFKGYGHNIVEGLAIGIENKQPLASQATSTLGQAVGSSFQSEKGSWFEAMWHNLTQFGTGLRQFFALSDWNDRPLRTPNFNPAASNDGLFADYQPLNRDVPATQHASAITVHFSPTIHIEGHQAPESTELKEQLINALRDPTMLFEIERVIRQATDQYQRRAY